MKNKYIKNYLIFLLLLFITGSLVLHSMYTKNKTSENSHFSIPTEQTPANQNLKQEGSDELMVWDDTIISKSSYNKNINDLSELKDAKNYLPINEIIK